MNRYAQYFLFFFIGIFIIGSGVGMFFEKPSIHSLLILVVGLIILTICYFRYNDIDKEMDKLVGLKK